MLSGDSISITIEMVKDYSIDCILLNCNPLDRTLMAAEYLAVNWPHKWGVYPNLGVGEPSPDGNILLNGGIMLMTNIKMLQESIQTRSHSKKLDNIY